MEECTKEETGVGAAIAAGSQAEKGTCALLVILPINKQTLATTKKLYITKLIVQTPLIKDQQETRINIESPIRLLKAVTIPAAKDLSF